MSDGSKGTQKVSKGKPRRLVPVRVKLLGFLSSIVPESEFEVEVERTSTVADLIGMLTESLGDAFRKAVVDRGSRLHGGIVVVLNKRPIPPREMASIVIHQKSNLVIIPLVDGG